MQRIVFLLVMITSLNSLGANGKAYLDIEEGQIVSVFSEPGVNWKSCRDKKGCAAVAWPDRDSKIEIVEGPVKRMVEDIYTGKMVEEEYYKIRYEYERRNSNGEIMVQGGLTNPKAVGWIDAAYVSKTKKQTFFGASEGQKEKCEVTTPKKGVQGLKDAVTPIAKAASGKGVVDTAEALKPFIGVCAIDPKNPPREYAKGNSYDTYVLPQLSKQKTPALLNSQGKPMTKEDLIAIDALSRTLYAEMARCYKHGLHYPMTVAKIVMNRSKSPNQKLYIVEKHSDEKNKMAKVATDATQFSLWLKKIDGKTNNSLRQGLCPPSVAGKNFWTGARPSQAELDIWTNTVRIATEAVLFPENFNRRTKDVTQFNYTSGLGKFYGMTQVNPSIDGHKISRDSCMEVWEDRRVAKK